MSKHRLLEKVAAGLRRRGLPRADIARLLEELNDHVTDILTEERSPMHESTKLNEKIETRVGRPELLVAAAVANRRHASFFGRHPVWSFIVAPIPLAVLAWFLFVFAFFGLLEGAAWLFGDAFEIEGKAVRDWPTWLFYTVKAFEYVAPFLPSAVVAVFFCRCANRAGVSWRWTLTACSLVAFVAWTLVVQMKLPEEPGQGEYMLGFGLPFFRLMNLAQLLVPLAVGMLFLWASRNRVPQAATR
jgi:hypothetical protein